MNHYKKLFLILITTIQLNGSKTMVRPDQLMQSSILNAPEEQPQFSDLLDTSLSNNKLLKQANYSLAKLSKKRKAVETFEKNYRNTFSGNGRNSIHGLKLQLVAAEQRLQDDLNKIRELHETISKKLKSSITNYKGKMAEVKLKHNQVSRDLSTEDHIAILPDQNMVEEQANTALEKYEQGPNSLLL